MADLYVIYGDKGIGKTSLVAMCNKPLLIDFEGSFDRALEYSKFEITYNGKCISIKNLQDILEVQKNISKISEGYETIFIDTIGGFQDILIPVLSASTRNGDMSQKQWGELSSKCLNFVRACVNSPCKRVIVLGHEMNVELKNEDTISYKIKSKGSATETDLINNAFAVGRIRKERTGTFLDFKDDLGSSCKCPDALQEISSFSIRSPEIKKMLDSGEELPKILQTQVFERIEEHRASYLEKKQKMDYHLNDYKSKIEAVKTEEELSKLESELQTNLTYPVIRKILLDVLNSKKIRLIAELKSKKEVVKIQDTKENSVCQNFRTTETSTTQPLPKTGVAMSKPTN